MYKSSLTANIDSEKMFKYRLFTCLILSIAKSFTKVVSEKNTSMDRQEMRTFTQSLTATKNSNIADQRLHNLNKEVKRMWKNVNFLWSNLKAFLLRKLPRGNLLKSHANTCPNPSDIAKRLVSISKSTHQPSNKKIFYKLDYGTLGGVSKHRWEFPDIWQKLN